MKKRMWNNHPLIKIASKESHITTTYKILFIIYDVKLCNWPFIDMRLDNPLVDNWDRLQYSVLEVAVAWIIWGVQHIDP